MIAPSRQLAYSGMLPGVIAGHYSQDACQIDVAALAQKSGATFVQGAAIGLDAGARTVLLENGVRVPFDVASFDVGATTELPHVEGFAKHAVPAKPLHLFAARWTDFMVTPGAKSVAVIGGGVAGVELALAAAHALRAENASVHVIEHGHVLSSGSALLRRRLRRALSRFGVLVHENADVTAVSDHGVHCADGTDILARFVIGAVGATPHAWMQNLPLAQTLGFVNVDAHLQTSLPGVFAVGDCAHMQYAPRAKAGVYAVRQAPVLSANLRAAVVGGTPQDYLPQRDYLKLISLGTRQALGEKYGLGFASPLLWRLKDRVDRQFVQQFK